MGSTNTKNKIYSEYSRESINKQIENGKIIIIVNNNVYDVTEFVKYHPGGENCFLNKNGKDCSYDLNFHSDEAKKLLKMFFIGKKI